MASVAGKSDKNFDRRCYRLNEVEDRSIQKVHPRMGGESSPYLSCSGDCSSDESEPTRCNRGLPPLCEGGDLCFAAALPISSENLTKSSGRNFKVQCVRLTCTIPPGHMETLPKFSSLARIVWSSKCGSSWMALISLYASRTILARQFKN